ncbi:MAG TPA: N-acetyltransferase [Caulobacteraceae bacterium]|nr:N-acetyltransferase [Caulobacteraceae bacterium]
MIVRPASAADYASIAKVVEAAFERPDEARMVEAARAEGVVLVELVAEEAGEVAGHVMFSRMTSVPPRLMAGLAPLSVDPSVQSQGLGTALGHAGVEACRALGVEAIVVLGHPAYYPRFGFSAEAARNVASPYAGRVSWMAMALAPGALDAPIRADYPAAFS